MAEARSYKENESGLWPTHELDLIMKIAVLMTI